MMPGNLFHFRVKFLGSPEAVIKNGHLPDDRFYYFLP